MNCVSPATPVFLYYVKRLAPTNHMKCQEVYRRIGYNYDRRIPKMTNSNSRGR